MSFKHEKRKNETELSKHLWQLKNKKKTLQAGGKSLPERSCTQTLRRDAIYAAQRNTLYIYETDLY